MSRWKGSPTDPKRESPPPVQRTVTTTAQSPVPPPIQPCPPPPPIQVQQASSPPNVQRRPRRRSRLFGLSLMLLLLIVTGISLKASWDNEFAWLDLVNAMTTELMGQPAYEIKSRSQITLANDQTETLDSAAIVPRRFVTNAVTRTPVVENESPPIDLDDIFNIDSTAIANDRLTSRETKSQPIPEAQSNTNSEGISTPSSYDESTGKEDIAAVIETERVVAKSESIEEPSSSDSNVMVAEVAADSQSSSAVCTPETCGPSRKLGTMIEWADDAEQAAKLAKEKGKLVFLIQVSGNFARDEFT